MLMNDEGTTVDDTLDIIALSDSTWRVTDRRFAVDATGVLAYLERVDGRIAVSIVYPPPMTDVIADCFAEAVALVSQRSHPREGPGS